MMGRFESPTRMVRTQRRTEPGGLLSRWLLGLVLKAGLLLPCWLVLVVVVLEGVRDRSEGYDRYR